MQYPSSEPQVSSPSNIHNNSVSLTEKSEDGGSDVLFSRRHKSVPRSVCMLNDGIGFYRNGHYSDALQRFLKVRDSRILQRTSGYDNVVAEMHANIGLAYLREGQYDDADKAFETAMNCFNRLSTKDFDDHLEKAAYIENSKTKILNDIGATKLLQGDHQTSLKYHWKALRGAASNGFKTNKTERAKSFYNIGRIKILQQDFSMALRTLNESLRLEKEMHGEDGIEIFDTLNLIGFAHYSIGDYDRAISIFTEALKVASRNYRSTNQNVAVSLINIGMVLERERDFGHALHYFSAALQVCENADLLEESSIFHLAKQSVGDVQKILSEIRDCKDSRNVKNEEVSPFSHDDDLSCSDLEMTSHAKLIGTRGSQPTCGKELYRRDFKGYYGERDQTKRFISEYREDTLWELDNSSIVVDIRDD